MTTVLIADAKLRPELFDWLGPLERDQLEELLAKRGWTLPKDLVTLWEQTGGGEIFEGESLLSPRGDAALGDNLFTYNEELRNRGLPPGYVVFHTGITVSAVRLEDARYVELDYDNFDERNVFESLNDWYLRLIRSQYAECYGLQPAPD